MTQIETHKVYIHRTGKGANKTLICLVFSFFLQNFIPIAEANSFASTRLADAVYNSYNNIISRQSGIFHEDVSETVCELIGDNIGRSAVDKLLTDSSFTKLEPYNGSYGEDRMIGNHFVSISQLNSNRFGSVQIIINIYFSHRDGSIAKCIAFIEGHFL